MSRVSGLILSFALAFSVFLVVPAFLGRPSSLYPLMMWGDTLDLLTPLVLLPLFFLLLVRSDPRQLTVRHTIVFLVVGAAWVMGQGMHLAANSIGHHIVGLESEVAKLTYMYDEVLSHYIWHCALIGLSALVIARLWKSPGFEEKTQWSWVAVAAFLYGSTFFLIIVEGRTGLVGVPFAALVALILLSRARSRLSVQPILAFFAVSYGIALLLFAVWAIYWRGLPEFSAVGII